MAYVLTDDKHYKDIGRAIQRKLGVVDNFYPEDMADAILSIPSGGGDIDQYRTFVQMNDVAAAFLADTTYQNQTYDDTDLSAINFTTSVMESTYRSAAEAAADRNPPVRGDECLPVTLSLNSAGNLTVTDGRKHIVTFEGVSAGDYKLHNVTPFEVDIYSNVNSINGQVTQCGSVSSTGQLRMIHTTSGEDSSASNYNSANVRDIGGWTCDSGYIKYGKIIRGSRFNGFSDTSLHVSDYDLHTFNELLHIRSEIDLRNIDELKGTTSSAFGPQVAWYNINIELYKDGVRNSKEEYCAIFKQIAYDVSHNNPIYIHCVAGRDRTGTVCALLEGLLGVARYNIDKDYEISSLTNFKYRYGTHAGEVTDDYNVSRSNSSSNSWKTFINYIATNYGGPTFRDQVIGYLADIGVTFDEMNALRQNLIEGTPSTIQPYEVSYNLSHVTTTTTSEYVAPYQAFATALAADSGYVDLTIQLIMNGVDVTEQYVSGSNIQIPEVTGNFEIIASASPSSVTYPVTINTTNATSAGAATATHGVSYSATIYPDEGYEILEENVSVVMNNVAQTGVVTLGTQGEGIISIPTVTGPIIINAEATLEQVWYPITKNLSHTISSSSASYIDEGGSYSTILSPDDPDWYALDLSQVTVTMDGGGTITKTAVTGGIEISTASVTGSIQIEATSTATFWTITCNLTEVTGNNQSTRVTKGSSYSLMLTPNTGCNFITSPASSCTMEGVPVTITTIPSGDNVGKQMIEIQSVSGNIIVTATAEHVDILSSAFFSGGKQYDSIGYVEGYRLNSRGGVVAATGDIPYFTLGKEITPGTYDITSGFIPLDLTGVSVGQETDALSGLSLKLYGADILWDGQSSTGNYYGYYEAVSTPGQLSVQKHLQRPVQEAASDVTDISNNVVTFRADANAADHARTLQGFYSVAYHTVENTSYCQIDIRLGKCVISASSSTGQIYYTQGYTGDIEGWRSIYCAEYLKFSQQYSGTINPRLYLYKTAQQ